MISRRKFFGLIAGGAAIAAKPALLPKRTRPSSVKVHFKVEKEVVIGAEGDVWYDATANQCWVFYCGEWRKTVMV